MEECRSRNWDSSDHCPVLQTVEMPCSKSLKSSFFPSLLLSLFFSRLSWPGLRSAPRKQCKTFIIQKRCCVEHCSDEARVATMAAEKIILCVLFEECSEPDEIGINTCLILQNTLDVTVTALVSRIKENIPIEWRDLWKLWFLIIVIQHLPHISGWKHKHFR